MGSLHNVIKTCDYAASSMKINSFPYDTCCQDSIDKAHVPLALSYAECPPRRWSVQSDPCGTERKPHVKSMGRENGNAASGQGPLAVNADALAHTSRHCAPTAHSARDTSYTTTKTCDATEDERSHCTSQSSRAVQGPAAPTKA
jgi:hypothetical protein